MESGKAEVGRLREEKKRSENSEDQRRKKMQAREKVGKSRFTVFCLTDANLCCFDKNWPKTVLFPQQSKTAWNWTVFVPQAVGKK